MLMLNNGEHEQILHAFKNGVDGTLFGNKYCNSGNSNGNNYILRGELIQHMQDLKLIRLGMQPEMAKCIQPPSLPGIPMNQAPPSTKRFHHQQQNPAESQQQSLQQLWWWPFTTTTATTPAATTRTTTRAGQQCQRPHRFAAFSFILSVAFNMFWLHPGPDTFNPTVFGLSLICPNASPKWQRLVSFSAKEPCFFHPWTKLWPWIVFDSLNRTFCFGVIISQPRWRVLWSVLRGISFFSCNIITTTATIMVTNLRQSAWPDLTCCTLCMVSFWQSHQPRATTLGISPRAVSQLRYGAVYSDSRQRIPWGFLPPSFTGIRADSCYDLVLYTLLMFV